MATAEIDIYNLALSHVGNARECQSTTENSAEANACRRYYAQTRDEILQEFRWPFATVTATLALVENTPTTEWAFAYRYPVDCLDFHRILGCLRTPTRESLIPYRVARDATAGKLLYTDQSDAVAEYTQQIEDATQFDPLFAQAVAFKLGFYIAPRVTGGDPYKLGNRAFELYQVMVAKATDAAANEEQPDPDPDASFIRARD